MNWVSKSDEEIIAATMGELSLLFPTEVCRYAKYIQKCYIQIKYIVRIHTKIYTIFKLCNDAV